MELREALFDRTSRNVRLTPLGEQLRLQIQPTYRQIMAAVDDVAAAARGISGLLTLVADGRAVALSQAEAAEYFPWPGLRYIPIRDAAPSEWALVWPRTAESALVRALADAARNVGPLGTTHEA